MGQGFMILFKKNSIIHQLRYLILKTQLTNGYHCVYLRNLDNKQKLKIHRVVALHFIQQLSDKTHVNHVDGNKENNTKSKKR